MHDGELADPFIGALWCPLENRKGEICIRRGQAVQTATLSASKEDIWELTQAIPLYADQRMEHFTAE